MSLSLIPTTLSAGEEWTTLLKMKGKELAHIPHNVRLYLQYHPHYKGFIRWNRFSLRVEITGGALASCVNPESIDSLVSHTEDHLHSTHDLSCSREDLGRRLVDVAMSNSYDPLQDYLDSLAWDGIPRLSSWLSTYGGAAPAPDNYVSVVGRKWMISAVARAYQPGCKADVVLVLEGDQGQHKSTLCRILGGPWFAEASGALGDKDSKLLVGTAWIVELPDMASFSKSDRNSMKAFFSSSLDRFRPPYGKGMIDILRRAVFIATTNDEDYLTDPTGNRRFWPVLLDEIDRARLIKDRDQLWAEAVYIYKTATNCANCKNTEMVVPGESGRCYAHAWWLSPEERVIAKMQTQLREEQDIWTAIVLEFAVNPISPFSNVPVPLTTANVLQHALGCKDLVKIGTREGMRVANILKKAGFHRGLRGSSAPWTHPKFPPK